MEGKKEEDVYIKRLKKEIKKDLRKNDKYYKQAKKVPFMDNKRPRRRKAKQEKRTNSKNCNSRTVSFPL